MRPFRKFVKAVAIGCCALWSGGGLAQTATATQSNAQKHLSAGIHLASKKSYKEARPELEKADAEQPGTFAILFSLGQVYLQLGEYPKAEATLNRASKLTSEPEETAETLYLLGETEAKESRPLDALDTLVKARKLAPKNVDILYATAEISMARKYFEDAIPLLEEALTIAPQRQDLQAALGECYFKSGKIERSIEVFSRLAAQRKAVEDHAYLGMAHTHLGRFAEAKADFNEGLKIDPGNSFCLFQLGYVAKLQGNTATAESILTKVLRAHADYPAALLELSNLRAEARRYAEARELLLRYVKTSPTAATGYYKLAMVERKLQNDAAAACDLSEFQRLSREQTESAHPYDHLLDYLDSRAQLSAGAQAEQDAATLEAESMAHPEQADVSYALAEAYLKASKVAEARQTIAAFDERHPEDSRTLTGLGVLLARHGMYDDAVSQFQRALTAKPGADDVWFDLATAYFRKSDYGDARKAAEAISEAGRKDDSYEALVADVDSHMGEPEKAEVLYRSAIARNPDNDQAYLSLALLELRQNQIAVAKETLQQGQKRVPGSGKIYWGLGLAAVLEGDVTTGGYFYFQTGQVTKAREVLERFKNNGATGGLDLQKIENALDGAADNPLKSDEVIRMQERVQVFQLASYLADTTL
jgi:tetratricopeptide (TPR) repeat protein